jgi:hypothetical protein
MPTNNRGGSSNRRRAGHNNNPEGRNQYSAGLNTFRDSPLTTAAAVGGAVVAGLFLWSRRNQITDQIGDLADQISEWREGMSSTGDAFADDASFVEKSARRTGRRKTQTEIAEEALTLKETGEAS